MQQTSVPESILDEEADSQGPDPSQQSPARVSATSIATTATTTVRIWNHARLWSAGGRYEERDYAVGPGAVTVARTVRPHTEPRRLGWGVVHWGAPRALGRLRTFARREGRAGGEHGLVAAWSNDAATKNLASLSLPAAEPAQLSS